jgi:hypothetical protein
MHFLTNEKSGAVFLTHEVESCSFTRCSIRVNNSLFIVRHRYLYTEEGGAFIHAYEAEEGKIYRQLLFIMGGRLAASVSSCISCWIINSSSLSIVYLSNNGAVKRPNTI